MRTYWMRWDDNGVLRIWGCEAYSASEAADKCKAVNGKNPIWHTISTKYGKL